MADIVFTPTERAPARVRRRELPQEGPLPPRLAWGVLGTGLAIVAYGIWGIAGITRHDVAGSPDYYVYRQLVFVAIGLISLVVMILIDPELYRRFDKQIYVGTLGLFALVFLAGTVARGS